LAIVVAAFLVLVIGQYLVRTFFLDPIRQADENIRAALVAKEKVERKLEAKNRLVRQWRSIGNRTLGNDPNKAFLILSARITTLINTAGLKDVSVKPVPLSLKKIGGIELYTPVAITLSAKGTIKQLVHFLEMVQQEPYVVKITGFTLHPEPKSDMLTISNCWNESIVLAEPQMKIAPTEKSPPIITATQPAPKTTQDIQYALISDKNIFKPYAPPVERPLVTRQPERQPSFTPPTSISQPQAGGPGRPGDIVATIVVGKESGAYIRNHSGAQWYKIGDRLQNTMQLEFVHPLGIVLRDATGKNVFVEIGKNIDQAAPLTEQAIPELYQAFDAWHRVH